MGALEIYWADMSHEMPEHEQITLGVGGKTHGTASWSGDMYVRAAGTAWWELPATAQWTRTRASIRHVGMIWRRRWEGCWLGDQEPRYSTHRNKWWGRMRFKYVFCWHTHRLEVSIVGSKEKSWNDTFFFLGACPFYIILHQWGLSLHMCRTFRIPLFPRWRYRIELSFSAAVSLAQVAP